MGNMEVKRNANRRGALRAARYLCAATTLLLAAQAQAQALIVEARDLDAACPWDSASRCARIVLHAGDGGNTFNASSDEAGVLVYGRDLQLQVWKNGQWTAFAPILGTFEAPDASVLLREGATWVNYVDVTTALDVAGQTSYRVEVKDASGAAYVSPTFSLTK